VFVGAGLIAVSLGIMVGLLAYPDLMRLWLGVEVWYVISALLAPVGYVIQDVVADAMTVEAVPRIDEDGKSIDPETRRLMHTTMQTLGRVAIVGGGVVVAIVNIAMFQNAESLPEVAKVGIYTKIYVMALVIPLISVLGVMLAILIRRRKTRHLVLKGYSREQAQSMLQTQVHRPAANWWILGGSVVFVLFTLVMGLSGLAYNQEIIFAGSMAIVLFLIAKLTRVLDAGARRVLIGTALLVFIYRALPGPGVGSSWWMIDELGFDQQFLSILALIGSSLTLAGMFIFRRFMAEKTMAYIIGVLTVVGTVLALPIIGMYYGLHEWTAAYTNGIIDARFIALVDTALESPLGQIAMIPMLAWIANSAPSELKATFFAVMASFTNLALSLGQLGTKYLNQIFTVTREIKDTQTGVVSTAADYSELGLLLLTVTTLGFVLPMMAILIVKMTRLRGVGDTRVSECQHNT
jgi:uncharacterized membrane protein YidH (DUF202 family)